MAARKLSISGKCWKIAVFFSFPLLVCCNHAPTYAGTCCSAGLIDASKLLHANLPGAPAGAMTWVAEYHPDQPIDFSKLLRKDSASPLVWVVNGADIQGSSFQPKARPADDHVEVMNVEVHRRNETQSDEFRLILLPPTTQARFDAWFDHEKNDLAWLSLLPPVYSTLGPGDSNPEPDHCGQKFWQGVHKLNSNFHPGGAFEMRSRPVEGGHGHQAVYDLQGLLIRKGPGEGSADKGAPTLFGLAGHRDQDVRPYVWAVQLDGNPVDPILFFRNLNGPLLRQGVHIAEYLSVRPALWGARPEVPAGTCIASR